MFLDIDGVLNSYPFLERHALDLHEDDDRYWRSMLDPDAIGRLNRLLATSGAAVVIASTWRRVLPLGRLRAILESRGLRGAVLGTTAPALGHRGRAVSAYLTAHPCRDYVILDDERGQEPHGERHVRTDPELGLTEAQVDEALRLLEGTEPSAR